MKFGTENVSQVWVPFLLHPFLFTYSVFQVNKEKPRLMLLKGKIFLTGKISVLLFNHF